MGYKPRYVAQQPQVTYQNSLLISLLFRFDEYGNLSDFFPEITVRNL